MRYTGLKIELEYFKNHPLSVIINQLIEKYIIKMYSLEYYV